MTGSGSFKFNFKLGLSCQLVTSTGTGYYIVLRRTACHLVILLCMPLALRLALTLAVGALCHCQWHRRRGGLGTSKLEVL